MYVPVHPGRGLGRDGDHRWGGCGACGFGETFIRHPGAGGRALGHYDPMRLKWLNNPSGKPQTPCDLGLCKIFPEAKTAAKAWARAIAPTAGLHDRHFCESLRPRNPSLLSRLPRKRHNRFHPRRSCARCSLKRESQHFVFSRFAGEDTGLMPSTSRPVLSPTAPSATHSRFAAPVCRCHRRAGWPVRWRAD